MKSYRKNQHKNTAVLQRRPSFPHITCAVLNVRRACEERGSVFLLTPPEYNGRPDVRVYETLMQPSESGHFQLTIGNISEELITLD